jgi:hypothetical protein
MNQKPNRQVWVSAYLIHVCRKERNLFSPEEAKRANAVPHPGALRLQLRVLKSAITLRGCPAYRAFTSLKI